MQVHTQESHSHKPYPMPIIVGSPRSGTTLLRFMLDSHPAMAIPPETGFLALGESLGAQQDLSPELFFQAVTSYPPDAPGWNDFGIPGEEFRAQLAEIKPFEVASGFRLFYRMYSDRFGKLRFGDKTPLYCRHLQSIEAVLPEAHFIHIIRDGRDAAVSLRSRFFSPGYDIETQASYWRENISLARSQGAQCRHYLELRYEDLLREPGRALRRICDFIKLTFDPAMLRFFEYSPGRLKEHLTRNHINGGTVITHEERLRQQEMTTRPPDMTRIGVWKKSLSSQECRRFAEIAGDLLMDLGYADIAD